MASHVPSMFPSHHPEPSKDIPAYIRQSWDQPSGIRPVTEMKIPVLAPVEEDASLTMHGSRSKEDEYDIPAFLRRNAET
jgi:hypothetical protein